MKRSRIKLTGYTGRTLMRRVLMTTALVLGCIACGGPSRTPTPSAPSVVPPPSVPPTPGRTPGAFRVSGTVLESGSPVPGGNVFIWFESRNVGYVTVEPDGRYEIAGVTAVPIIRLTWVPSYALNGL